MAGGVIKRAPSWMQECGLEWAYRFLQEPTRLFHRYFVRDLPFLVKIVCRTLAERRMRGGDTSHPVADLSAD